MIDWYDYADHFSEYETKCAILREVLVCLNYKRLGEPDKHFITALVGITDVDQLTRMNVRAHKASSWQEVLQTPCTWEEVLQTP